MNPELIDRLTAQYVWSIQSERVWYDKASTALKHNNFGQFRRYTGTEINKIERMQDEKLEGMSWAFVVFELWRQMGGNISRCLSDPGTLTNEYAALVAEGTAAKVDAMPPTEYVRKKGDLFGIYGEVYTYRNHAIEKQGHTYSEAEMTFMRKSYENGSNFKSIATSMHRTALGVCEKMRLMGLIDRNSAGDYVCAVDVRKASVTNPCSEISLGESVPCTLPHEIKEHIESAAGHFDRVATALETIVKEKETMTITANPTVAIETKTIIFGQDAATMSEQQLIDAIKRVEGDIAKLKEVKTKSKKIAANITELEANLAAIVAVLDAR